MDIINIIAAIVSERFILTIYRREVGNKWYTVNGTLPGGPQWRLQIRSDSIRAFYINSSNSHIGWTFELADPECFSKLEELIA